jgi:hypothetical protein
MSVRVRGGATAEELAAVLAVLTGPSPDPAPSRYQQWRATRLQARRRAVGNDDRPI